MVAAMQNKDFWIQLRLFNKLESTEEIVHNKDGSVVCVSVPASLTTKEFKRHIFQELKMEHLLQEDDANKVVCKLRNSDGTLMLLTNKLEENDSSRPFVLEIVDIHQHVKASEWKMPPLYADNAKDRIRHLSERVKDLELKMTELSANYAHKVEEELRFLTTQTHVLKHILKEMDRSQ